MSNALSRLQAIILGLGLSAAVLAGTGAIFVVGAHHHAWGPTFQLRAGFGQIHGVGIGTRVRLLGKDVGEVRAIELPARPSGEVVLALVIDDGVHHLVRSDASAQIVAEGMVGGKVVEVLPGSDGAGIIADGARIPSKPMTDLNHVLARLGASMDALEHGSLGQLVSERQAYDELIRLIRQGRGTMASLQQDADALKELPLVRGYVRDPFKYLIRPDCRSQRHWFSEADLFEPSTAILTPTGRQRLDELAGWIHTIQDKRSEVVVASFAIAAADPDIARAVTQKQSEVVCDYLTNQHGVHKTGIFSRRKVTPVGCGGEDIAIDPNERLPAPRLEVVVHIPAS
jgi:phospholipid/cholesterol/gamma-HCH transport system substrate-binding protein